MIFFNILIKNISTGKYNLKNIGTFKIVFKKERLGRNPKTNEEFLNFFQKINNF